MTSYTPATADDYLREMTDPELVAAIGGAETAEAARAALVAEVEASFGAAPSDKALADVIECMRKHEVADLAA